MSIKPDPREVPVIYFVFYLRCRVSYLLELRRFLYFFLTLLTARYFIKKQELMMRQMASFRLTDKKYNTEESVSLVASSNIYGLLFVGIPEKLLAIKVADISELNASSSSSSSKKRSLIELDNLPHKESFLPSCPTVVSLSSDQLTLLVCVTKSGCPFGWLYDVRGCARQVNCKNT